MSWAWHGEAEEKLKLRLAAVDLPFSLCSYLLVLGEPVSRSPALGPASGTSQALALLSPRGPAQLLALGSAPGAPGAWTDPVSRQVGCN